MASARVVDSDESISAKTNDSRLSVLKTERELHYVIKHKDADAFIELLNGGIDVNVTFSYDPPLISLIQHVVQENFLEGIEFMLTQRNSKSSRDWNNVAYYNAFAYAVKNDMIDVVRVYLLSSLQSDVTSVLSIQDTYRYAMKMTQYDIAASAVEHSAFKVQHPTDAEPALHVAVRADHVALGSILILKGAKIDAVDRRGVTALAIACGNYSYKCCSLLLRHGADPNHESYNVLPKSPLYSLLIRLAHEPHTVNHETIHDIDDVVGLFIAMGMQISEEARNWVLYVESQIGAILPKLGNVKHACLRPSSLAMICKSWIRNDLSRLTNGASIVERVNRLPLPLHVKNQLITQQN